MDRRSIFKIGVAALAVAPLFGRKAEALLVAGLRALAEGVGRSPLVRPHQTGHDVYRQREHRRIEKK